MSRIDFLRREIDKLAAMLAEAPPDTGEDLARDLGYVSLRRHLTDLREKLRSALLLRDKEIIEFDLGETREPGTVRLGLLAKLSGTFAAAVEHTARYKWRGTRRGPMPREIMTTMDLRLAALAGGSTRLFVVGNTAPDLFGKSILEDSLRETFAVLQAQDTEALSSAVAVVGPSGTSALKELARRVAAEELPISIKWEAPEEEIFYYEAQPPQLRALAQSLDEFATIERDPLIVSGKIITVSLREPLAIETADSTIYQARVPPDLLGAMETLNVGSNTSAELLPIVIRNRTTGKEKTTYGLIRLIPRSV